tara:strand:+ start:1398 stop:1793 length:396 start_codon:yes stop_codon:yes gene_type:complete
MIKIVGWIISGVFLYFTMYVCAAAAGITIMGYVDTIGFLFVIGISYFGTVAAHGKFSLDINGLKFMNKLIVPCGFLGALTGMIMLLYSLGGYDSENMLSKLGLSLAVTLITIFYSIIFRIILSIVIESKEN